MEERAEFDLSSLCNILNKLGLQLSFNENKDLNCFVEIGDYTKQPPKADDSVSGI